MNWYVQIGNEQRGPISSEELKRLASSGTVVESTPIRQGIDGKLSTASKVKGLQFKVVAPPPFPDVPTAAANTRKCPFCAEEINAEAIKCKHCGEFLNADSGLRDSATKSKKLEFAKIAESQRTLIIILLVAFLLQGPVFLMAYGVPELGLLTQLVLIVLQAIATFRLAKHCYTDGGLALIFTFLALIPLFGLVTLLIVNSKATKLLQSHGLKVGLLGVDKSQLQNI